MIASFFSIRRYHLIRAKIFLDRGERPRSITSTVGRGSFHSRSRSRGG